MNEGEGASAGDAVSVRGLFASPVLAEAWTGARVHNAALRSAIANRQTGGGGVAKSNIHGWQSDIDMLRWGGEAARQLVDHVLARCGQVTADLRGEGQFRWYPEMWANVSQAGASNQTHAHPGSYWSAVYYVDDGYAGSTDKALGGELTFLDPRFPMVRMRAPDLRRRGTDGQPENHEVWLRPRSGLLVMFPSWLQHAVRPYRGNGRRISIAINVSLTRLAVLPHD
jgi:uncharacterized protein (TIGR02466 family)